MEKTHEFKKLDGLVKAIPILVWITIVTQFLRDGANIAFIAVSTPSGDTAIEGIFALLLLGSALAFLLSLVVTAVLVWRFMSRANSNVRAFGTEELKFTPNSVIWWWFVPIMNLFKPQHAMDEIYKASFHTKNQTLDPKKTAPLVEKWWACWLISGFVANIGMNMGSEVVGLATSVCSSILSLFAGIFLIKLVKEIQEHQLQWPHAS